MSEETIFSKIIRKEIPAEIVLETEDILAFKDINPQAPTHVLVIPKAPIKSLSSAAAKDTEILGKLFLAAAEVAEKEGIAESGYRVVVNNGTHGQQTVHHIHLHVIGGRQLKWPPG